MGVFAFQINRDRGPCFRDLDYFISRFNRDYVVIARRDLQHYTYICTCPKYNGAGFKYLIPVATSNAGLIKWPF